MRAVEWPSLLTLALVTACSSGSTTSTTSDAGIDGGGDATQGADPCFVQTGAGNNFIGDSRFESQLGKPDVTRDLQWSIQAFNELKVMLDKQTEGVDGFGMRMYNACKKFAEAYGATGNEIARAADEASVDLKITKTCELALQFVDSKAELGLQAPSYVVAPTCVARVADGAACTTASQSASTTVCRTADGDDKPLVNGECVDAELLLAGEGCTGIALSKMKCADSLGSERVTYMSMAASAGKDNGPVLQFMESLPFFFPANDKIRMSQSDMFEHALLSYQAIAEYGPRGLTPSCSQRFRSQVGAAVAPFRAMQAIAKKLRTKAGMP